MSPSSTPSAEPVTREQYNRLARYAKRLEGLIDDAFERIAEVDGRLTENVDEAIHRASRAERAVRRLKKEIDEG